MNRAGQAVRTLDRVQQRHGWLAFLVAVWKKFSDDQAGNLAALVAYYGFASLFPLLLVFVTVLDIVLRGDPALRDRVLSTTLAQFPGFHAQLSNVHSLPATGPALVLGLILTFLGARGVAGAVQNALNTVWAIPYYRRPGFPWNLLRGLAMITVVGLGLIVTSFLTGVAAGVGRVLTGTSGPAGTVVVSLVVNIAVFWLAFRLGTAREVTWREHFPAALASAVVWQILLLTGGSQDWPPPSRRPFRLVAAPATPVTNRTVTGAQRGRAGVSVSTSMCSSARRAPAAAYSAYAWRSCGVSGGGARLRGHSLRARTMAPSTAYRVACACR